MVHEKISRKEAASELNFKSMRAQQLLRNSRIFRFLALQFLSNNMHPSPVAKKGTTLFCELLNIFLCVAKVVMTDAALV